MFGPEGGSAEALILMGAAELTIKGLQGAEYLIIKHIDANKIKKIKEANEIGNATLGQVNIPAFYSLEGKEEKSESYKSLDMSHAALEAMVYQKIVPSEDDLQNYGLIIYSAKLCLYSFLCEMHERIPLFNVDDHNVTYVICVSLIALLDRHCGAFRGYQDDQKILPLISECIDKFSYRHDGTEDERDHLSNAVKFLKLAEKELEEHGKTLSFVDKLDKLYQKCRDINEALMPLILKLITKEENWKYIDRANVIDLAKALIKPKYAHGTTLHNDAISISESPYKAGMILCFKDFLASITITKANPELKFETQTNKYPLLKFSQAELGMHPPTVLKELSNKLHHITPPPIVSYFHFFEDFVNWMTSLAVRPDSRFEKSVKFVPITNAGDLANRAQLVPMLLELSTKISIFQAFCLSAKSDRKHIGDDYINSPHHCNFSIGVMTQFGKLMSNDSVASGALIRMIQLNNPNIMLPEVHDTHFKKLEKCVIDVKKDIAKKVMDLENLHKSFDSSPDAVGVIIPEKYKMLNLCVTVAGSYNIMSEHEIKEKVQAELKDTMHTKLPSVPSTPISARKPLVTTSLQTPSTSRTPSINTNFPPIILGSAPSIQTNGSSSLPPVTPIKSPVPALNFGQSAPSQRQGQPVPSFNRFNEIKLPNIMRPKTPELTMAQILAQLKVMTNEKENGQSKPSKEVIKEWRELHKILSELSLNAVKMQLMNDTTSQKKGENISQWVYSVAEMALQFMKNQIDVEIFDNSMKGKFETLSNAEILQKMGINPAQKKQLIDPIYSAVENLVKRSVK